GARFETLAYRNDQGKEVLDAHLLEPRVGVSWDATGDARNVFKVFGGTYADPSLLALPSIANSRANSTAQFINENIAGWIFGQNCDNNSPLGPNPCDFNGDGVISDRVPAGGFGGPGGSHFSHHGHLQMTNVAEFQASYERQLDAVSAAGLTLVRRKTYDI